MVLTDDNFSMLISIEVLELLNATTLDLSAYYLRPHISTYIWMWPFFRPIKFITCYFNIVEGTKERFKIPYNPKETFPKFLKVLMNNQGANKREDLKLASKNVEFVLFIEICFWSVCLGT